MGLNIKFYVIELYYTVVSDSYRDIQHFDGLYMP